MITSIHKDIFESNASIIAHQVNCKGIMGAGLAAEIAKRYPKVEREYKYFCAPVYPSSDLLGTCQIVGIGNKRYIANLFGQDAYGTYKVQTRYDALEEAMKRLLEDATNLGVNSIAFPYGMGCGLAGGNWTVVDHLIQEVYLQSDINIEICIKG